MNCLRCLFKSFLAAGARIVPVFILVVCVTHNAGAQSGMNRSVRVTVDGQKLLQRIDGIGVNANTRSWDGKNLQRALDLLLDSMNATIWRVIAETMDNWEVVNDNQDPFQFNWKYYNKLYETSKFQKVWKVIGYLNRRGISHNVMINFMGFAPAWMGEKVLEPEYEDEYVEMVVSFFYYAIKRKKLRFGLIAPTNETDHYVASEGPHLTAEQHARILNKIIRRMTSLGIMDGIRIVAPDNANTNKALEQFVPAMMQDSLLMRHVAHLAFHSYQGNAKDVLPFISNSPYPEKTFWITEWNEWCNGCDEGIPGKYDYGFARASISNLLSLLKSGAGACLVWEGFDSYYSHHAPSLFSYWGVLGYDAENKSYYPRKLFYAIQHVSRFITPGSRQIDIEQSGDSIIMFSSIDSSRNKFILTGINHFSSKVDIVIAVRNLPGVGKVSGIFSDSLRNFVLLENVSTKNGDIQLQVPAGSIFTIETSLSTSTTSVNKISSTQFQAFKQDELLSVLPFRPFLR